MASSPRVPLAPEALRQVHSERSAQHGPALLLISHPPAPTPLRPEAITLADWHFDTQTSPLDMGQAQAIGEAKAAWARFLIGVHDRLHPVFSGEYLTSLDSLPVTNHPLNDEALSVTVGLEATQSNGEISALYVRRSSGVPAFDVAALAALLRVFPLPIPAEIASYNGRIYFEWTLHRDAGACSTFNAMPRRLAGPAPSAG